MLVYEKKVDGQRHLFGTVENTIPGEDDVQLIYKCTHRCLTEHLKQSVYTDPQNHV